ncbi:unnamed protein product [Soboliphyme baturini]|uniref:ECSIT_Cterm domain-containing protein n=1 Tax=Soboliphyme baturini TaxID=241478 RepID=A0A183J4Q4_9BILA|nr:unnamed protein product [Soboliphyme baturini]
MIFRHPSNQPIYVDGPFRVWVNDQSFFHFVLRASPKEHVHFETFRSDEPPTADEWANWQTKYTAEFPESRREVIQLPTIHEQTDGTILAIAITGTSSKESLMCWIKFLQTANPKLKHIPVIFRLRHALGEVATNFKPETANVAAETVGS